MAEQTTATTAVAIERPPILSFPAILRNPGLNSRFAHLQQETSDRTTNKRSINATLKKQYRHQNDGKRWIRRKDNAQFVGNPHIVAAGKRDYAIPVPQTRPTFPEPLPAYLPRSVKLPSVAQPPPTDPASANAGRFSLSMKGMRRELRRQRGRAEPLVRGVEDAVVSWLHLGGTILAPDRSNILGPNAPALEEGVPVNNTRIIEVSRTPLQLIWRIPDDAFARYVVHCCARYHEVVSFSKGTDADRLTYLLRPNVTKPDRRAPNALETPPATDIDYSSNPDSDSNIDSDFVSDRDFESDVEAGDTTLTAIQEVSSPALSSSVLHEEDENEQGDTWSIIDETEADVESSNELDLEASVGALSLSPASPPAPIASFEAVERAAVSPRSLHRTHPLTETRRMRSASSPRSPVRIRGRRHKALRVPPPVTGQRSFYEYVFR